MGCIAAITSAETGVFSRIQSSTTVLEAKVFPIKGAADGLEPQVLDFRYTPQRWQACIGLPDDPHKTIVGSDGGLYYDYGGGRFHDFKTRILARLETQGQKGRIKQSLAHPRIPIVATEQTTGSLTLHQQAWAGGPREEDISEWSQRRVDYLWLKVINTGSQPQRGHIVVQIDSHRRLVVSEDKARLFEIGRPEKTFCRLSPACDSFQPPSASQDSAAGAAIEITQSPGISRGWATPTVPCDPRFRDVMVGYGRPLEFTYKVVPDKTYCVGFGLIEGWHSEPGVRPLEIRIEGKAVCSIDLVAEHGKNVPVVLLFDAQDQNRDGVIEMGVHSPGDAEDKNTILTSLWIFDADNTPTEQELLKEDLDNRALAVIYPQKVGDSVKLLFLDKELAPGQEYRALLSFYQGKLASVRTTEAQAERERDRAIEYWRQVNLPYDRIAVPDPAVQNVLDSCIRNIYQSRELRDGRPAFQVGPTCYRGTWAADGPFILEAVTYLGRHKETRKGLEVQVEKDEGPGGVQFSKKSGLRLWMIWRHAQLTGDWSWLEEMWPKARQNVNQIIEYRRMTRDDPSQVNYGLMPSGFGDGGLGGVHREYTNVYWTLAGLRAAILMAERLSKPVLSEWKAEYADYWRVFDKARNRDKLADSAGNIYVPVTMKGEQIQAPQRGAWAFLQSIFPGRIFDLDDELMLGTIAMLDANQSEGLIYGTGWLPDGIWNYAASFYAHAHLWLDHGPKAAATLYAFGNHACPLLCWREEHNVKGEKEKYVGDMPHNWASAEFIRLVRHLLILERGDELHLFGALPRAWTRPDSRMQLLQIPTSFGLISLTFEVDKSGDSATIKIEPPRREPPKKIAVHLEHFSRLPKRVTSRLEAGSFLVNVDFGRLP
jgi:hypothetical protein